MMYVIVEFVMGLNATSGTVVTLAGLLAYLIAQGIKILIDRYRDGGLSLNMVMDAGGMPSSHTAVVVAVCAMIGVIEGLDSILFALALMTASIVIYDALHIRFFAGEQAKVLNNITKALNKSDKSILPSRFKHPLGHILPEVIGGIIVGLATTIIAYIIHAHILEWLQFVLTKNI